MRRSKSRKTENVDVPAVSARSNRADLKTRFEAVTKEIAADLRVITNEITDAVMDAIAASSGADESLREAVFMAVSLKVLQNFVLGLNDRLSSSDVRSSRSVPDVRNLAMELPPGDGSKSRSR